MTEQEQIRSKKISDSPPHYVAPDVSVNGYWRQFLTCDNGECVIGMGVTPEQATQEAEADRIESNRLHGLSDIEKIREILTDAKHSNGVGLPYPAKLAFILRSMARLQGIPIMEPKSRSSRY